MLEEGNKVTMDSDGKQPMCDGGHGLDKNVHWEERNE